MSAKTVFIKTEKGRAGEEFRWGTATGCAVR